MVFQLALLLIAATATTTLDTSTEEPTRAEQVSSGESRGLGQPRRGVMGPTSQSTATAPSESAEADRNEATLGITGSDLWRVLAALGSVLALIFLMRAFLLRGARHLTGFPNHKHSIVEVMLRQPIARSQNLLLLRLGDRLLLLHENTANKSMASLCEVRDPNEATKLINQLKGKPDPDGAGEESNVNDAWEPRSEVVDLTRRPTGGFARLLSGSSLS